MSFRRFLLASLLLAPLCASAQHVGTAAKRPMTFADLMAMKRVSDPQISPSGKWVMFSVTDVSLEKNTKTNHLWVVPLDGSAKERQLTSGPGESDGRFAPDGKHISLTMKDQVFEMPWDDAAGKVGAAEGITDVPGGASGAIWSPDSQRLLFAMNVYPECSDLGTWAKEYACDAAKQKAADASPVKAQVFTHLLYRHWDAWTGERRSHVAVIDADGRGLRDLTPRSAVGDAETPTFSLGGPLGYAWAPDSHEIAYVTNLEVGFAKPGVYPQPGESTNNDVFTLKLDDAGARAVKVSTSPGSDDGPQYSPDGKWLAWRSQARDGYESDKIDLVVMDRASGSIRNLTAEFDGWVDEFRWDLSNPSISFTSAYHGEERIYGLVFDRTRVGIALDAVGGEYSDVRELPINGGPMRFLLASKMTAESPVELVRIELHDVMEPTWLEKNGKLHLPEGEHRANAQTSSEQQPLTHLNDALGAQLQLPKMESFWFASANGDKVQGFFIRPPNFDEHKKYPLKFLIHGGPQGAWGDAWSYRWNPELFAANGYVVVMVNPHGSVGYGQKFLEEVSGDWGGLPYSDLMRGLDYAEQHYGFIDKNRECALGASYGGYMANWVLTHTNRFKCIVTHDGMYNPQSAFGTTEELWFNEWEFRPRTGAAAATQKRTAPANGRKKSNGEQEAGVEQTKPAYPWDFYGLSNEQDPFRKFSPMLAIKNAHTPTLVIHSQKDYRLDVSEGFQLFTALQLLGVPSKMLYFPDEGHWVLKPQNSELWYSTVNDWCDRWLGMGKYAGVGPERNTAAAPVGKATQPAAKAARPRAQRPATKNKVDK